MTRDCTRKTKKTKTPEVQRIYTSSTPLSALLISWMHHLALQGHLAIFTLLHLGYIVGPDTHLKETKIENNEKDIAQPFKKINGGGNLHHLKHDIILHTRNTFIRKRISLNNISVETIIIITF